MPEKVIPTELVKEDTGVGDVGGGEIAAVLVDVCPGFLAPGAGVVVGDGELELENGGQC
jgi:predicted HAD superfamily phosphohydrolase